MDDFIGVGLWLGTLIIGAISSYLFFRYHFQGQIQRTLELRHQERLGRTRAEGKVRDLAKELRELRAKLPECQVQEDGKICICTPIATLKSCFDQRNGTPRNFGCCPSALSIIELGKNIPIDSLQGLENFSHVWVISWFHENTKGGEKIKAKVSPPRLNGEKTGLFSTRTPHRPNAISLSLAKLESVAGRTLRLSGLDMIDGTPVLDIKPYVTCYDALHEARVPEWINAPPRVMESGWKLIITPDQDRAIRNNLRRSQLYKDCPDKYFDLLREIIALDFRSVSRKDKMEKGLTTKQHSLCVDGQLFQFEISDESVTILSNEIVKKGTQQKSEHKNPSNSNNDAI